MRCLLGELLRDLLLMDFSHLGFLSGSAVRSPPARKGSQLPSLGQEGPLEKEMATHFSIPAWKIPQTGEHGYSPLDRKEWDTA